MHRNSRISTISGRAAFAVAGYAINTSNASNMFLGNDIWHACRENLQVAVNSRLNGPIGHEKGDRT
jgi:hypothetical protein